MHACAPEFLAVTYWNYGETAGIIYHLFYINYSTNQKCKLRLFVNTVWFLTDRKYAASLAFVLVFFSLRNATGSGKQIVRRMTGIVKQNTTEITEPARRERAECAQGMKWTWRALSQTLILSWSDTLGTNEHHAPSTGHYAELKTRGVYLYMPNTGS